MVCRTLICFFHILADGYIYVEKKNSIWYYMKTITQLMVTDITMELFHPTIPEFAEDRPLSRPSLPRVNSCSFPAGKGAEYRGGVRQSINQSIN